MATYKNSVAAEIFGVKPYTVTRWAKQFRNHLSIKNLPEGQNLVYTDEDMGKLAYIQKSKDANKPVEVIELDLLNGATAPPPDDIDALALIGSDEIPRSLTVRVAKLEHELKAITERALKAEGENEGLRRQMKEKDAEIRDLYKKIWQHGID